MNETVLLEKLAELLLPDMAIVVIALVILGYLLKRTPSVQDWIIPWVLLVVSIAVSVFMLKFTIVAVLQGILAAGAAVLTHQLWKQTTHKTGGE